MVVLHPASADSDTNSTSLSDSDAESDVDGTPNILLTVDMMQGQRVASGRMVGDRRPLKRVHLSPPEYKIEPKILQEGCVEKEVLYLGKVKNVPLDLDPTNRTEVLREIDRGKREEDLPWQVTFEQDAIFYLSIQNIKVSKRDGKEEVLLRVAIHEIAAICYIRDDTQHVLAIKFGNQRHTEFCQLAVMYCHDKNSADELCALVSQCFHLIYTEATMEFLDAQVLEGANGISLESSTSKSEQSSASTPRDQSKMSLTFLSQSQLNLDQNPSTLGGAGGTMSSTPSLGRRGSNTHQDSELGMKAKELLQDYMKKLHTKLNADELKRFAQLMKAWRKDMAFTDFCEKVFELYGPERRYLLSGLWPFIPEENSPYFENFLRQMGISESGMYTQSVSPSVIRHYRRTYSQTSGHSIGMDAANGVEDDYDRDLNNISYDIERLGSTVDMSINPDSYLQHTS